MCIVCLCDFENGEGLRKIGACKHIFHEKCFNMWLSKDKSCPFCKENLSWEVLEKNCPNGHDWEMEKQFEIEGQVQNQVALEKEINIVSGKGGRMQTQPRLVDYGSPARGNFKRGSIIISNSREDVLTKQLGRRATNDGSPGGLMGGITTSNWM
jgi:hypothetical protein